MANNQSMHSPMLVSTNVDMQNLRKKIIAWLDFVHGFGGPEVLSYENFLKHPEKPSTANAISQCLRMAKEKADGGFIVINKRPGSPICGHDEISTETDHRIKEWCSSKHRGHMISSLPNNRSRPPVVWGEAFLINQNKKPVFVLIYNGSLKLACDYIALAKSCRGKPQGEIKDRLANLFEGYRDIKSANSGSTTSIASDGWIWRMLWLCEYIAWFIDENIVLRSWENEDEVLTFFREQYNWIFKASNSSSFWVHGNGAALSTIKKLAAQLHGEIWIWNSDLRILRSKEWFRDVYLPMADRYTAIKIAISSNIESMAKSQWRTTLIENLESMGGLDAQGKIMIGVMGNDTDGDSLVALFGADSNEFSDKRVAMITPLLIGGRAHECISFVLEPSSGASVGEKVVITTLHSNLMGKMENIVFKPLREILN